MTLPRKFTKFQITLFMLAIFAVWVVVYFGYGLGKTWELWG